MGDENTTLEENSKSEEQAESTVEEPVAKEREDGGQNVDADAAEEQQEDKAAVDVESLEAELQEAKEQSLRVAAEMQNVRKRAERDVENAHKYGQEKLINALLPVLDNLDRAIEAIKKSSSDEAQTATVQPLLEGVELTSKSMLDALQAFNVEVIEPYGEPFDPQQHEAMTMVPSDTAEPNSVIDVLQKGYALNGRLLRAAMVVIAK